MADIRGETPSKIPLFVDVAAIELLGGRRYRPEHVGVKSPTCVARVVSRVARRHGVTAVSTEDLLQSWRDATKAAELARRLAEVALRNAERAEADSTTAEEIAVLAEEAAASAQRAAEAARTAARKARHIAAEMRDVGVTDADQSVVATEAAEGHARDAYHEAEDQARAKWLSDDKSV